MYLELSIFPTSNAFLDEWLETYGESDNADLIKIPASF